MPTPVWKILKFSERERNISWVTFLKPRKEFEIRTVYYNMNYNTKSIEIVDIAIDI